MLLPSSARHRLARGRDVSAARAIPWRATIHARRSRRMTSCDTIRAMKMLALVLALSAPVYADISLELDLSRLMQAHADRARVRKTLRCGITVPGHTIVAPAGVTVIVRRRRYVVPHDRELSFVDLRDSEKVMVNGRWVSLAHGPQDQFGFRRIEAGR